MSRFILAIALLLAITLPQHNAMAIDDARAKAAQDAIDKGIAALRKTQTPDGSWSPKPGPAVTALVAGAMLDDSRVKTDDPQLAKAIAFVMGKVRPDGGIHDGMLENYNTAICLSMLSKINDRADAKAAITKAQDYLRGLQWSNQKDPQGKTIDEAHPFFGGAGYGREGRPDMSNTQMMIEGLHDSGLDCNDPAYQRALVFITKCQGTKANKTYGDKIKPDGGFIYSTSLSKDKIGELESKPGAETVDVPGQGAKSLMRTYGSMTYAGFKSYVYAKLDRNDPRVVDAFNWIRHNYDFSINPGLIDDPKTPTDERKQGYFYYLMTAARALQAWGNNEITTTDGKKHDWRADMIDKIVALQHADGTWANDADRWMEGDANLTTAYALIALRHALR